VRRARRDPPAAYSSPACFLHEFESATGIEIKRIYTAASGADGYRALVDRLWPRGISKQRAALDAWLVDLAPSAALRSWLHRDFNRWPEFVRRYRAELRAQRPALEELRQRARRQRVTLLYAARDPAVNHAVVLRDVLQQRRTTVRRPRTES
jgi:uncharacterized protein YeaO (DUF488 family)